MDMSVVDHIHEPSTLRVEAPDFAIAPSTDDTLSVSHEGHAVALHVRDLNSQDFVSVLSVPDSDVVHGAGGEDVGVAVREHNVVDLGVVASVPQLGLEGG